MKRIITLLGLLALIFSLAACQQDRSLDNAEKHTIKMNAGDRLFLYTDGVTEAQNKGQELLGDEALEELLRRHTDAGTANLIDEVIKAIRAFADGAEQADDITMLTFRVTPDNN